MSQVDGSQQAIDMMNNLSALNMTNVTITLPDYNHNISLGKLNVVYYDDGNNSNLTNCGEEVYGPVLVQELRKLDANNFSLIINNSSKIWIGGCKEVIKNFRKIPYVIFKVNETEDFKDILYWTPENKIVRDYK